MWTDLIEFKNHETKKRKNLHIVKDLGERKAEVSGGGKREGGAESK